MALWLIGQSTPQTNAAMRALRPAVDRPERNPKEAALLPAGSFVFGTCSWIMDFDSSVAWSSLDAAFAQQLLQRPIADVTRVIAGSWGVLTNPSTPTSTLVDLFDLAPAQPLNASGFASDEC